jgi:hypothetical protein
LHYAPRAASGANAAPLAAKGHQRVARPPLATESALGERYFANEVANSTRYLCLVLSYGRRSPS